MTNRQKLALVALIALAFYAASDPDALSKCEKLHSTETCMHEIYNGN